MMDDKLLNIPKSFFRTDYWLDKFNKKLDKGDAFIDLLGSSSNNRLTISYRELAKRWGWSSSSAQRFIDNLCADKYIKRRTVGGKTVLYINTSVPNDGTPNGTVNDTVNGTPNGTPNHSDSQGVMNFHGTANDTPNGTVVGTSVGTPKTENPNISITKKWLSIPVIERKEIFTQLTKDRYQEKYGYEMIQEFLTYWSYLEEGDKTMRFEEVRNKKFHIGRRLGTWNTNFKRKNNTRGGNIELDFARPRSNATASISGINYDE